MEKIKSMVEMQLALNNATNGMNWRQGTTSEGKEIDWGRCIYLEVAELVESYPWKHWKNIDAKPDMDNVYIELVDIWHFIMSELLREASTRKTRSSRGKIRTFNDEESIDYCLNVVASAQYYKQVHAGEKHTFDISNTEQMKTVERMLHPLFEGRIAKVVDVFFEFAALLNFSLDELYALYMSKNVLNTFRQDNGYKDGTYKKTWSGKEDNVYITEALKVNPDMSPDELYNYLNDTYNDLVRFNEGVENDANNEL